MQAYWRVEMKRYFVPGNAVFQCTPATSSYLVRKLIKLLHMGGTYYTGGHFGAFGSNHRNVVPLCRVGKYF
jgi:hypothetical protein